MTTAAASAPFVLLSRVLLLIGVLTGLGAMHLVSAPGAGHSSMAMTAMPVAAMEAVSTATHTLVGDEPSTHPMAHQADAVASPGPAGDGMDDHSLMSDCIVFAATGTALLSALFAARRGPPPGSWPRVALRVIRI
jgi:hypothetical protein